ncbi:diguanylate cyclase [Marinomonas ushuaiensis DSM 15871]|uniref:diguanylate cyclase n=1 Tax=Marinomonas ushuaiensis DSM 15871 TaxID=1122207 RepID=X7E6W0_9GAMM|nr:GGDEF domain-containing protein [Marinomonas ushuaiensis]ETX11809.1 diguanylate cyclase [Marinomonas ushuaiensis DSM 15871]
MFNTIKKLIDKLLNLGFADDFGNDLNQKHVVSFSYLAFCSGCLIVLFLFVFFQMFFLASFSFVCLSLGLLGWRYSYSGYYERAQVLMPIVSSVQVFVLSFFYFGDSSDFHWLFVNVLIYGVIVFRADQRFIKHSVVISSVVLFLICEFLTIEGLHITAESQNVVAVTVFLFVSFYVAVVINLVISRLKSVNSHLRTLAEMDELTGLSNRRKVLADAVNIFADSVINGLSCVFAIIDLDHFKKINDTYGHEAGDLALSQIAKVMSSAIRPQDEIGRYGGEEFIVIMRDINLNQAEVVVENIRKSVEEMLVETEQGVVIPVTISAGLAAITPDVSRYEEILAQADKGLYSAKRNGRNRIFIQSEY